MQFPVMAFHKDELTVGPLASFLEVVVFVVLTGIAWYNGVELLVTTFISCKCWSGAYFYCLVASTLGVLVYQLSIFMVTFAAHTNMYGIVTGIGIGWSAMVLGQSLVLWSRLHLVCPSIWKRRLGLYLIVINAICMHTLQFAISFLAVKENSINTHRKSLDMIEKISLAVFSVQETLLSTVFLVEALRVLKVTESAGPEICSRNRVKWLVVANVLLIAITITTIALGHLAPWGIWASFKGFGYSVKLKIELSVFKNLKTTRCTIGPDTAEMQITDNSNMTAGQRMSSWYENFTWPQRLSLQKLRPEEMAKGKQTERSSADSARKRADKGDISSVHEGPLGDRDRDGLSSLHVRYFSEVALSPEGV